MLRAGRRWQRGGCDYRQGEYVHGGEEVWCDGEDYAYRSWSTHGWGGGAPTDAHESVERWDEAKLRERLAGELIGYDWECAPFGASPRPESFDPRLPMPGCLERSLLPVTPDDLDRVVGHLQRGYSFEHSGLERRGAGEVWGRERLAHLAWNAKFVRTRCWAYGDGGGDVRVCTEVWTDAEVREFLVARPDVVHSDRWPTGA